MVLYIAAAAPHAAHAAARLLARKSAIGTDASGPRSAMAEEPAPEPAPADAEGLFAKADALTEAEDPSGALAVLLDGETE